MQEQLKIDSGKWKVSVSLRDGSNDLAEKKHFFDQQRPRKGQEGLQGCHCEPVRRLVRKDRVENNSSLPTLRLLVAGQARLVPTLSTVIPYSLFTIH